MKISISIHLRSIVIHGPATRLLHPKYLTISHTTRRQNITLEEHAGSRIDPKIGTKLKTTDQLPPPFFFSSSFNECITAAERAPIKVIYPMIHNSRQSEPLAFLPTPMRGLLRASQKVSTNTRARGSTPTPKLGTI